jgi:hypothetical protein
MKPATVTVLILTALNTMLFASLIGGVTATIMLLTLAFIVLVELLVKNVLTALLLLLLLFFIYALSPLSVPIFCEFDHICRDESTWRASKGLAVTLAVISTVLCTLLVAMRVRK